MIMREAILSYHDGCYQVASNKDEEKKAYTKMFTFNNNDVKEMQHGFTENWCNYDYEQFIFGKMGRDV